MTLGKASSDSGDSFVSALPISASVSAQTPAVSGHKHHHHGGGKPPSLDNTASLLGESSDDLTTQLKSGKTLNDIATAQGVSSTALVAALKTDITANRPADAPAVSDAQLTQMATGIAAGKGPGGPGGGGGFGGSRPVSSATDVDATKAEANLKQMASTLGVSQTDLLNQLSSGVSFSALLGNAGTNPYTASTYAVSGGLAVDQYA
jgi:hypothetical protein